MVKPKDILLVIIQFILLIGFALSPKGVGPSFFYPFIDFTLTVTGILIASLAFLKLNTSFTPFPAPREKGMLETEGIYKFIRHPLYTGSLLIVLGIALYSSSYIRLIITGILYFLFLYKSGYEEQMLIEKYPEYKKYKSKTGRFIPKIST